LAQFSNARLHQWIIGRRKRQLVDNHQRQRIAPHVDAFQN